FLNEIVVAQVSASERKRKSVGEIENAHGCCPVVVSEASQARPGDPTCAATRRNSGFRAATRRLPSRCAGARDHRRTASEAVCSYSAPRTAQTAAWDALARSAFAARTVARRAPSRRSGRRTLRGRA